MRRFVFQTRKWVRNIMSGSRRGIVERYGEDRIQAFESAAIQRHAEAEFLSENDYRFAAVYFFGYATELRLKSACYRYAGFKPSDPITKESREAVAAKARNFGLSTIGPHDLAGWSRLLVAFRGLRKPKADASFNQNIIEKAASIARSWAPQMRYRATEISKNDSAEVRASADWFKHHYTRIIPS